MTVSRQPDDPDVQLREANAKYEHLIWMQTMDSAAGDLSDEEDRAAAAAIDRQDVRVTIYLEEHRDVLDREHSPRWMRAWYARLDEVTNEREISDYASEGLISLDTLLKSMEIRHRDLTSQQETYATIAAGDKHQPWVGKFRARIAQQAADLRDDLETHRDALEGQRPWMAKWYRDIDAATLGWGPSSSLEPLERTVEADGSLRPARGEQIPGTADTLAHLVGQAGQADSDHYSGADSQSVELGRALDRWEGADLDLDMS